MAAYAALVSVMHIIDTIKHHHSPPISIDKQQLESLTQILTSLQEFLEGYKSPVADGDEADPLEMRIADAAHAVEDVIESHIVDVIELGRSMSPNEENSREEVSCIDFYQNLQQVIEEMNVIKKEAMEIAAEAQLQRKVSSTHAGSLKSSSTVKETMMVGFDDVVLQLLEWLTGGQRKRQIIPITGMGGIGKTTLARHIYEHALVKEHFDFCAWTTISQTYNVRETLSQVLHQVSGNLGSDLTEEDLGEKLYKYLCGRSRYLIILDDMWSVEVWEKMMVFFPDKNDGSRIIVTTRLSNLATKLTNSNSIGMRFLDDVSSWSLFSKTVFGDEVFPLQLEEIGKKITYILSYLSCLAIMFLIYPFYTLFLLNLNSDSFSEKYTYTVYPSIMAAYAALVSVMHIIDTIEHHHSPPISIHKQQLESLTQILTSLQEFLEGYKSPVADEDEADSLEMRIVDAAHAVEDVIESHIVNVIQLGRSMSPNEVSFCHC